MLTKLMRTRRLTGLCSQSFCEADKVLKSIDGAFCSSLSCKAMQRMKANFLPVSWTSLRRDRETVVSIPERAPLHRACSVSIVGTSNFARDGHAGLLHKKKAATPQAAGRGDQAQQAGLGAAVSQGNRLVARELPNVELLRLHKELGEEIKRRKLDLGPD